MSRENKTSAEALEERELRILAYLDEELSEEERRRFEKELDSDELLREELEIHRSTFGALKDLQVRAPKNFALKVEGKIRSRSRGRFFEDDFFYRTRVPYEAFAAVMLVAMAAIFFFAKPKAPEIKENSNVAAMGGEPSGRDAGQSSDGAQGPDTSPQPPREVAPIVRDQIVYTIERAVADPESAAKALAKQISATSSTYKVEETGPGKLKVALPRSAVESFLVGFGKEARVHKMRMKRGAGPGGDEATIVIHLKESPTTP